MAHGSHHEVQRVHHPDRPSPPFRAHIIPHLSEREMHTHKWNAINAVEYKYKNAIDLRCEDNSLSIRDTMIACVEQSRNESFYQVYINRLKST